MSLPNLLWTKAMPKKRVLIFILCTFFFIPIHSQDVGVVLSGGGAKGAVHIGIIKALEENNIPIDYIAGTSIGAIVGSMYAMGYTPEEMLELFLSEEFYYWQTGKIEEEYRFYFRKGMDKPDFVHFNIPLRDSVDIRTAILPNSLVNPVQMNQAFLQLFAPATAQSQGNFNNLFVPFLCVASDTHNKKPIIFRSGDLGDAVRASMSFPFVFKPIVVDTVPLFDGGIYDNFPVTPMKEAFHPDFIIGSVVAGGSKKPPSEQGIYEQLEGMIMHDTEYNVDPEDGVMLRFKLDDVSLLDFNRAKELYDMGYEATIEMIDSIKMRVNRRVSSEEVTEKRKSYRKETPELIFRHIYISGIYEDQKRYVESQIHRDNDDQFTFNDFKKTYFRLLSNTKIKEIFPHAEWDSESKVFDLFLDIQVKDEIKMDFGGNISSMSANQLYIGLGYQSLTELAMKWNLDLQVGNTYSGVGLSGKLELPSTIPIDISGSVMYNYRKYYESEKLFIDTDVSTFIRQYEFFGKLGVGLPVQNKAKTSILFGYGELEDRYYPNSQETYYDRNLDKSIYRLFSFSVLYNKNTLDAKQYPIFGQDHHVYAQYISGTEKYTPGDKKRSAPNHYQSWIQLSGKINNYHRISDKFNLGYLLETTLSSKNLWSNYTASVLQAPAFTPTTHSKLVFNEYFRANQYLAGGISPILKLNSMLHLRGDFYAFAPLFSIKRGNDQKAYYGDFMSEQYYLGEVSLVAQFPFISIGFFGNYYSHPKDNWNFGLNIGYLIFGQNFIH